MKNRTFMIAAVALLTLLVSACGPLTIEQAAPLRTVSVLGVGQANLVPDIAYINIGVHTESATASDAVSENNAQTQKVIQALKDFGIDAKDIRTSNFSIWPMDKYDPSTGMPSGEKTYSVDNSVYITIRDLEKIGDLLDTVITAGANTVNSIQFDVAEKDAALKQARADAVKDAEVRAQELAEAAGVELGEIHTISFFDSAYPIFDGRGGGAASEAAAVPIQPGQLTFTVTVNITYVIK